MKKKTLTGKNVPTIKLLKYHNEKNNDKKEL